MTLKAFKVNPIHIMCITLLVIILAVVLAGKPVEPTYLPHRCIDYTHQECDGACECDGLGCSRATTRELDIYPTLNLQTNNNMRDYQIQVEDDANILLIYAGDKLIGTYPYKWDTRLGKMIGIDRD